MRPLLELYAADPISRHPFAWRRYHCAKDLFYYLLLALTEASHRLHRVSALFPLRRGPHLVRAMRPRPARETGSCAA